MTEEGLGSGSGLGKGKYSPIKRVRGQGSGVRRAASHSRALPRLPSPDSSVEKKKNLCLGTRRPD